MIYKNWFINCGLLLIYAKLKLIQWIGRDGTQIYEKRNNLLFYQTFGSVLYSKDAKEHINFFFSHSLDTNVFFLFGKRIFFFPRWKKRENDQRAKKCWMCHKFFISFPPSQRPFIVHLLPFFIETTNNSICPLSTISSPISLLSSIHLTPQLVQHRKELFNPFLASANVVCQYKPKGAFRINFPSFFFCCETENGRDVLFIICRVCAFFLLCHAICHQIFYLLFCLLIHFFCLPEPSNFCSISFF